MGRCVIRYTMLVGAGLCVSNPISAQPSGCSGREKTVRRAAAATVFIAGNVALYSYFENAWWSGEPSKFHFRSDWDENQRDQDKFGHLLGGFHLTQVGSALLQEACVPPRRALLLSAAYATAFQLQIEIWDGYQQIYGFSVPDMLFNAAGAGFAVARGLNSTIASFKPTMSYSPTLANRTRREHGNEPRATVDYSGQTYWLSADIDALLPREARHLWPGVLRASLGHSITDYFPPPAFVSVRAERRLLFSIDLNAAKLPGEMRGWRTLKRALSYYHLPSPALEIVPTTRLILWYR